MTFKPDNNDRRPTVKVMRTAEGTAFEIAIAVLNIIMWGLIAWMWARLPETVPAHFNLTGSPDGYGEKWLVVLTGAFGTLTSALTCFSAYRPTSIISLPVQLKKPAQFASAVRLVRIIGVLVSLMFIFIVWSMGGKAVGGSAVAGRFAIGFVVVILAVTVYYTERIRKQK